MIFQFDAIDFIKKKSYSNLVVCKIYQLKNIVGIMCVKIFGKGPL